VTGHAAPEHRALPHNAGMGRVMDWSFADVDRLLMFPSHQTLVTGKRGLRPGHSERAGMAPSGRPGVCGSNRTY
jgi:hypothetical protein